MSVPGEARLRGGLRRSQNAEKLQAWAEARAAVSLIGLLAVWARDGVVRREAGYCCGVRAASLGVCVPMVLYAVCAGRLAVCAAESG